MSTTRRTSGVHSQKRPLGPNGEKLCFNCRKELPKGRTYNCSKKCSEEWSYKTSPSIMRSAVLKRDKGICALCGTDTIALRAEYDKLSREWRRAGHVREFYSVAEHSVRVSLACPPEHAAWGLLHDASEAYLVDLPRPLKRFSEMGRLYMEAEARVMKAVCERFGLSSEQPEIVGKLDTVLLMTEKRDLMCAEPKPWEDTEAPLDEIIRPWNPQRAALEFLHRYAELGLTERTTEGECEVSQTAHERPEEPRLKKVGP